MPFQYNPDGSLERRDLLDPHDRRRIPFAGQKASCSTALRIFIRGMGGLLARSCRNRNGANERDSSTKGSTKSLGMLAQTFGKPAISTALHGARTLWGRLFSRTWENMLPEQTSAGRASGGTGGWKPT